MLKSEPASDHTLLWLCWSPLQYDCGINIIQKIVSHCYFIYVEATARATLFWIYDNQRFVSDFFSWFLVRAQSYCTFNNNITKREPAKQSFSSECHFWNLPPKNTPLSVRERHFCSCMKFTFYPIFFNKFLVNSLVGFNFWPNLDWTNKWIIFNILCTHL